MSFRLPFAPPTPAQQEHWRKVRIAGKKNFIWKVGVIRFGGTMFIVMTALDSLRNQPFPIFGMLLGLVVWPLAGYCWGAVMWHFYESHFSKTTGQPTNQS